LLKIGEECRVVGLALIHLMTDGANLIAVVEVSRWCVTVCAVCCLTDNGDGPQPSNAAGADETAGSSNQQP